MNKIQDLDLKMVGARIRSARQSLNLTQVVLAERSYLTSQFVSRVETGNERASVDAYYRIATVLGLTVDDLLYDDVTIARLHRAFSKEGIFGDCTVFEKAVISETMLALKESLKRNRMK